MCHFCTDRWTTACTESIRFFPVLGEGFQTRETREFGGEVFLRWAPNPVYQLCIQWYHVNNGMPEVEPVDPLQMMLLCSFSSIIKVTAWNRNVKRSNYDSGARLFIWRIQKEVELQLKNSKEHNVVHLNFDWNKPKSNIMKLKLSAAGEIFWFGGT